MLTKTHIMMILSQPLCSYSLMLNVQWREAANEQTSEFEVGTPAIIPLRPFCMLYRQVHT